jgi:lipid-A-disaccharide synthase-like uncharacterized protein
MVLESWVAHAIAKLAAKWAETSTTELVWIGIGFGAQGMFFMRFVIQWLASEKAKKSVMPHAFWYWSIAGGSMLLLYSIYRLDPVFIMGQGMGLFIYIRNLQFIRRTKRGAADPADVGTAPPGYKHAAE